MNASNLFILSGPSGAGEDSIIDGLSKRLPTERVITTTTRVPRKGESEGMPYYFVSRETFESRIDAGEFAEWAEEYNGNFYGVAMAELERVISSGRIGIWKIEWKGVMTAKRLFPEIIAILITAPLSSIEARIRNRDNASDAYIAERMAYTEEWMRHTEIYDYTIENRDGELERAVSEAENIIRACLSRTDGR
ncbi:MAG: hypothetical protein HGB18_03140 [Candidatus Moranbacteria bacterium]|nr:hypothetical protein [Candidatus Moranbacteria bacterium]